jgi:two-component system chemotaxis response regulator CheV
MLSNILLDKEILLESGTNELEVLVFDVADYTFGINVAKVREVLPATAITSLPHAHRSIRGVFKLRNRVIPCVSLLDHLGIVATRENTESTMILTDLNQQQTAFLVDAVERIHRLSWENILAVPGLGALSHTPVTALARCEGRLVVMLDFEMILDDVTDHYFRTDEVANPLGLARESLRIILAEDSPTVREAIGNTLRTSGYVQLSFYENGAAAWQGIEARLKETGRVEDVCDLVIADVEMPQIDGLHLTKRIKQHPQLKQIPVLLYSSIITPDNRKKGEAVGADAQVAKPELAKVVQLADELISNARRGNVAAALEQITKAAHAASVAPPAPAEPQSSSSSQTSSSVVASPVGITAPEPSSARSTELLEPAAAERVERSAPTSITASAQSDAPTGVNPKLWQTFHDELVGRTSHLQDLLQQALAGDAGEGLVREVARTLHTVKSASMVVPVDPVTQCTHAAESLLELARRDHGQWPHEPLAQYARWLQELTSASNDVDQVLAGGHQLEAELGRVLADARG